MQKDVKKIKSELSSKEEEIKGLQLKIKEVVEEGQLQKLKCEEKSRALKELEKNFKKTGSE